MNASLAQELIAKALDKACQLDTNVCIAITDAGAHLHAFYRMDNAFIGSVDIAIAKARTSALFFMPSGEFGKIVREEKLTGMELSNQNLMGFPGGEPISQNGRVIGAVGISGGAPQQDAEIAKFVAQFITGEHFVSV